MPIRGPVWMLFDSTPHAQRIVESIVVYCHPAAICSYYVPILPKGDPRTPRLHDRGPHDILTVQCACGRQGRFATGELQGRHRLPSDTPLYDLQYRMRCGFSRCRRTKGIRVVLWGGPRVSPHDVGLHVVVVEGDVPQRVRV
jgi:hypothetical protein